MTTEQKKRQKDYFSNFAVTYAGVTDIMSIIPNFPDFQTVTTDINLQLSQIEYIPALGLFFLTLSDTKHHYKYFTVDEGDFVIDQIIKITSFSAFYDEYNSVYFIKLESYKILTKALYQIFPLTNDYLLSCQIISKCKTSDEVFGTIENLTSLNTFVCLYVRVISKSVMLGYIKNQNNVFQGHFCYFDIIDKNKETLRVVASGENAYYFFKLLFVDRVYEITGSFYKTPIKTFTEIDNKKLIYKNNPELQKPKFEISLGGEATVRECFDDENLLSLKDLNNIEYFTSFSEILTDNSVHRIQLFDVVGYVDKASSVSKNTYALRKVKLIDKHKNEMWCNLWNAYTVYPILRGDIILIRNIQVRKYLNKTPSIVLSTLDDGITEIEINPKNEEAFELKIALGLELDYTSTTLTFIREVETNNYQRSSRSSLKLRTLLCYLSEVVTPIEELLLPGCPSANCKSSLESMNKGYFCSRCKKFYFQPTYQYKPLVVCNFIDCSGVIACKIEKEKLIESVFGNPNLLNQNKIINACYNEQYTVVISRNKCKDNVYLVEHIEKKNKLINTLLVKEIKLKINN